MQLTRPFMSATNFVGTQSRARLFSPGAFVPGLLVAFVLGARLLTQWRLFGTPAIEDDAYYYTLIAQHLIENGASTFDGQALTNGYHPLWLLIVTVETWLFGPAHLPIIVTEVLLVAAAAQIVANAFTNASLLFRIAFAAGLCLLAWPMVARGMEVSLFVFAFALFTRVALSLRDGKGGAFALGLAATFAIGARIDSAVFVLPIALLSVRSLRDGVRMLIPVGVAGVLYAAANLWMFGIAFPISGAIKSLGGFQKNTALLQQAATYFTHAVDIPHGVAAFGGSFLGRPLVMAALCAFALPFMRRTDRSWPVLLGFCAGFALFLVKLVLFSSWVVWPWYAFPVLIGFVALFLLLDDVVRKARGRIALGPRAALAVFATVALAAQVRGATAQPQAGFEGLNRLAVGAWSAQLAGARIAMGDRAGSFADAYAGPVTQLEGLVNDLAYFRAVERHDDLRPLLCARGVRYVVAYQRDLGDYKQVTVPVQRSALTSFRSPALVFAKGDEVGHIYDRAAFDNAADDEGDSHLYLWRLRCEP